MFDEKNEEPATRDSFIASHGWCENFMRRHGFSLRRKTTTAQKTPPFSWIALCPTLCMFADCKSNIHLHFQIF